MFYCIIGSRVMNTGDYYKNTHTCKRWPNYRNKQRNGRFTKNVKWGWNYSTPPEGTR